MRSVNVPPTSTPIRIPLSMFPSTGASTIACNTALKRDRLKAGATSGNFPVQAGFTAPRSQDLRDFGRSLLYRSSHFADACPVQSILWCRQIQGCCNSPRSIRNGDPYADYIHSPAAEVHRITPGSNFLEFQLEIGPIGNAGACQRGKFLWEKMFQFVLVERCEHSQAASSAIRRDARTKLQ